MYICCECGNAFEEPEEYVETHGLDYPPYEHLYESPCCGGNYIEAERCSLCGDYITSETYVEIDDKKYCEDCFTIRRLDEF